MAIDLHRVKEIFLGATEHADEAARAAYVDRACAGDAGLRDRVEALLRSHDPAGSFLASPAVKSPEVDSRATQELSSAQTSEDANEADNDLKFLDKPRRADSLGRVGHYEMLQVLGRGGFGIVFRAFDDTLQRVVAVKVMAPQIATLSPARKRFLREARSSAAVRHENVVQIYEVGEQPLPYLAMEFIPGETLQQKLDRTGPLDVSEVLRIGRQIAEGLAAAHACHLIHRDIKPGNILLEGGSHKAKITDFGLARAADDASISQSGIIAGTPMFMSPEQALGHKIDQRADLFSLGSVLYQMASGRPPFRAPSALAVLKRVAEEPPRPIPEIIPETPEWLCGIIAKLHAKNPDDRFQSAREVADVLADCEQQLATHNEPEDVSRIPRGKPAAGRRRPWKLALMIPLVVLLALLVTWAWPSLANYSRNLGELEILPGEGLVSVIVLQNDEGLLDGDKLHPRVTDWLNMKNRHTLTLPSGKYQLNVGTWPAGTSVREWEVTTSGLFASSQTWVPVVNTSAIITLERGQRVTLRPKMSADPIKPANAPAPGQVAQQDALPRTFTNSIGMEFVIVPNGKSWLGGGKDKLGGQEVVIPADFYLGKYEVTQEEWEKVMGANPSNISRTGGAMDMVKDISDADLKRFPVEMVTWDQCQLFAAKLDGMEKETGWIYRLPKEAEWEYACRGGPMSDKLDSAFDFYFAKPTHTLLLGQANFEHGNGLKRTCKVGSYEPNVLGLYDMHGNVWEWCDDTYKAGDASLRAHRGGCWVNDSGDCRAAIRITTPTSHRDNGLGLRLARVPSGAPSAEAKTPPPAVVQALREAVSAKERSLETARAQYTAGFVSRMDLLAQESELIDTRIRLAETQLNKAVVLAQLEELVKIREEERDITATLVKAGRAAVAELNNADVRLAEAKARHAKARSERP
jgi:serine/threonine protein kinase